jgi:hypothetical protein
MSVHAICPNLRCQKILELPDDVRGHEVTCRYCSMLFRVPRIRRRPLRVAPDRTVPAERFTIKVQ